jgi:hypothetical protein
VFAKKEGAVGAHYLPTCCEDHGGTTIIPVMDNMLEQIGISTPRYRVEEAARFDATPIGHVIPGQQCSRFARYMREIEQDACECWTGPEYLGKQTARSPSDIDTTHWKRVKS